MSELIVHKSEPPYASLQREVQRKLGKCHLRLQQYEMLLKDLLARRRLASSPGSSAQDAFARNVEKYSNKTLGSLVGSFTSDYLRPALRESETAEADVSLQVANLDSAWLSVSFQLSISVDDHAELIQQHRELVDLRNMLAHHFLEKFDVMSADGCLEVDSFLQESYELIDKHYGKLNEWAKVLAENYTRVGALIKSPQFREWIKQQQAL